MKLTNQDASRRDEGHWNGNAIGESEDIGAAEGSGMATENAISNCPPHSRQRAGLAPWTPTSALRRPRKKVFENSNRKGRTESLLLI